MGNPAGVRRDFDKLEKRRFEAIRLWERGESQAAIARQLKVAHQTAILRHSNVAVTQRCYIKTVSDDAVLAMQRLSDRVARSKLPHT